MWQWKNFENWPVFDEVNFFGPPCRVGHDTIYGAVVIAVIVRVDLFHLMNAAHRRATADFRSYRPTWAASPPEEAAVHSLNIHHRRFILTLSQKHY